jgi:5-methyltetrahydrofolate--homocysteine methyltransferase
MEGLMQRIRRGEIIIADGAMGTILFQKGLKPHECPEKINLSRPDIPEQIAAEYLEAGAEIIQTNTFGGSPLKLNKYSLDDKTEQINRRAVECVRRAVGDKAYISGSVGPSGQILIPYGDTAPEQIYESALRQINSLIDAGVDVLCIETMTDISEATLNIRAARSISPTIPIMATMTFDQTPKGFFTIMGVTVEKAATALEKAGANLVGSNCGHGIEMMVKIAREFKTHSRLPLIIQPNAGLPELIDGVPVYKETPEIMAEKARELVAAGVSVIGGCCGTTPDHIAAIKQVVKSLSDQV